MPTQIPVNRTNQAFNKMLASDRTAQLEDQHDERAEDRVAKTKNLFIDGECNKAQHAINCIANMIMFINWMYINGENTFWCLQLTGIFDLLVSDASRSWLDLIVSTHPHIPFNLVMEVHVILQAIFINMVKNQPWLQHIADNLEIPFD